jgi:tRNA (guanine37-N1)-methyltransferase
MKFAVVSLMPEMFDAIRDFGVTSRAFERNLVSLTVVNPRTFAEDRHGTVDDRPYGGGPGMVLKAEPMLAAVAAAKSAVGGSPMVVHFSPRGKPLDQGMLAEWVENFDEMVFLTSRYEGLDERVIESVVDLEVCVGDFVVSGGELPAMMALDALIRLLPGALGDESSKNDESFIDGLLEYPQYTRPETVGGRGVPEVLLSGDHKAIAQWRQEQSLIVTQRMRPDLLDRRGLSDQEARFLDTASQKLE